MNVGLFVLREKLSTGLESTPQKDWMLCENSEKVPSVIHKFQNSMISLEIMKCGEELMSPHFIYQRVRINVVA